MSSQQLIIVRSDNQSLSCFEQDKLVYSYSISTGKNGLGEQEGSECTPRGWHQIHQVIGQDHQENSVFVGRQWTGEIYSEELGRVFPNRDWILTRIVQLDGLQPGLNKGGSVDSLSRYIYIHGTPDTTELGKPGSRGCIRMRNSDIIQLCNWIESSAKIHIR